MSKIISQDTKDAICKMYLQAPVRLKEMQAIFGLSQPTISKILDEGGIARYKKAQVYNPYLCEDYFHCLDTQNKAYYLGLIISDGNVFETDDGNRQSSISITLQGKDRYILERFKSEIRTNTSVASDGRGAYTIAVRSDTMSNDLAQYGVHPRKSFDTYLPLIRDDLVRHLIRGILDGDGCVQAGQTSVRGRYKHTVGFCGTQVLMEQIKSHLVELIGVTDVSVYSYKNKRLSMVTWASLDDIQDIYNYLYEDAEIFMKRKHDKFIEIFQHYGKSN